MIEYVLLGKALMPLAGRAAAVALQKVVSTQKTAWGLAAEVADELSEFVVDKRRLRAAIQRDDFIAAFCDEDPVRGAREAVRIFKIELRKQTEWRDLAAEELDRRCALVVEETAKALVRHLPVPIGLALLDARAAVRAEASRTRDEEALLILNAIQAQTAPSALDLANLPPSIEPEVRQLVGPVLLARLSSTSSRMPQTQHLTSRRGLAIRPPG